MRRLYRCTVHCTILFIIAFKHTVQQFTENDLVTAESQLVLYNNARNIFYFYFNKNISFTTRQKLLNVSAITAIKPIKMGSNKRPQESPHIT